LNLVNNEKYIINVIKYGAIASIIIVALIITQMFIYQKNNELNSDIKVLEENYLIQNKILVENLVNKFYKLIELEKEFKRNDFNNEIKQEVEQAYSIAMTIYNENIKKPNYSKEKTINSIKSALRVIRFNNNSGYFFLYEMQGKNILNTEFPNIEDTNLWNYKDARGTLILQEMNKILSTKNETTYEWYWKKDITDEKEYKKIGFFKKFEPFDMFIGAGYYEKEFNEQIQKRILIKLNSFQLKKPEHIFIYDLNGLSLINPIKELIGTNRYDIKNDKGEYPLRKLLDFTVKNKEGFIEYKSSVKLNENLKSSNKTSFLKLYEDFGWMIGSIAHQWKQPLSIISMSNGLLKINREIKDFSTPKEIDKAMNNIDNSIQHLSQTIDDFRNFFNPNKEKCIYKISEALKDTLKLIDSQFKNNNIEIIKDINEVELFGSKNELLQTLINLLKNAKEALLINTNLEKKYIFISTYKEDNQLVIKIKDNANGIPIDIINNVFNPYFTTKEKAGGTGIGLYMCKQIIEGNMKGKIEVSNIEYIYENKTYFGAEFVIKISLDLEEN
jgi:signal transduction histidine kinase